MFLFGKLSILLFDHHHVIVGSGEFALFASRMILQHCGVDASDLVAEIDGVDTE